MTTITRASQERQTATVRKSSEAHRSEVHIDSDRGGVPPDPFESSVHGREVHVAKQKQTQKEVKGQLEITRKITATETTEVEHKARTQERVVQGQVVSFHFFPYYFARLLIFPFYQNRNRPSHLISRKRSSRAAFSNTRAPVSKLNSKAIPVRPSPGSAKISPSRTRPSSRSTI